VAAATLMMQHSHRQPAIKSAKSGAAEGYFIISNFSISEGPSCDAFYTLELETNGILND
jgi:hypothetical protein